MGDRRGEGMALANLGTTYANVGETRRAIDLFEQRLVIAREIGDRRGEGSVLANLGVVCANLGETPRAIAFYQQGLATGQAISDPRIISLCEEGLKRCGAVS
jgi:tetratricopeptide (TPR) repeat protein